MSLPRNEIKAIISDEALSEAEKISKILDSHKRELQGVETEHQENVSKLNQTIETMQKGKTDLETALETAKNEGAEIQKALDTQRAQHQAESENLQRSQIIRGKLEQAGFKGSVLDLLGSDPKIQELPMKDGKVEGLDAYLETVKTTHADLIPKVIDQKGLQVQGNPGTPPTDQKLSRSQVEALSPEEALKAHREGRIDYAKE